MSKLEAELKIYEHLDGLLECVRNELDEPLRSNMVSVCNILKASCCPLITAEAKRRLDEGLARLERQKWIPNEAQDRDR